MNLVRALSFDVADAVLLHVAGDQAGKCPAQIDGQLVRLLIAVGFLGGFTTFSAFSLDAVRLWERGAGASAATYVVASVALSRAAVMAGLWIARTAAG